MDLRTFRLSAATPKKVMAFGFTDMPMTFPSAAPRRASPATASPVRCVSHDIASASGARSDM
ncbi:hypothetical protein CSR02_05840 [Acetobacter pomorum]|uniref:Uncharacterized protein n=1 Tax=Acetobacter pomorum TaxID=65959 RepID=A0A2G4RD95_9PROT|nr:hypothetical protein CSR02_05840 [Acetobacter pomorum]